MDKKFLKQEAIDRMIMLDLHKNIIKEFEKENILNISRNGGMLYWLTDEEKALVEEFEEKHNYVVYHIIHNYSEFGEMLSLLYVTQDENEWDYDKDDIRHGTALAYVINLECDDFSEFGTIGIKPQFGGLIRTY